MPVGFERARTLYFEGTNGNQSAYHQADELFTALYAAHERSPRIQVYYGSLRLLEAAHTWMLWKKHALSKQGIELMDAAVAAVPNDLEVRFVRAATTFELPPFFHRRTQSEQDFKFLSDRAEDAVREKTLDPKLAAASLYFYAEFMREAKKEEVAAAFWKRAIHLAPASRAARDSEEELKKIAPGH